MEQTQVKLHEKLRLARKQARLTQAQVAQVLTMSLSAISGMETGQRGVEAGELFKLSQLYGKPLEWFFDQPAAISIKEGVRWYDTDPLIREALHLLKQASPTLRRKAAYGLMGFLSDR